MSKKPKASSKQRGPIKVDGLKERLVTVGDLDPAKALYGSEQRTAIARALPNQLQPNDAAKLVQAAVRSGLRMYRRLVRDNQQFTKTEWGEAAELAGQALAKMKSILEIFAPTVGNPVVLTFMEDVRFKEKFEKLPPDAPIKMSARVALGYRFFVGTIMEFVPVVERTRQRLDDVFREIEAAAARDKKTGKKPKVAAYQLAVNELRDAWLAAGCDVQERALFSQFVKAALSPAAPRSKTSFTKQVNTALKGQSTISNFRSTGDPIS